MKCSDGTSRLDENRALDRRAHFSKSLWLVVFDLRKKVYITKFYGIENLWSWKREWIVISRNSSIYRRVYRRGSSLPFTAARRLHFLDYSPAAEPLATFLLINIAACFPKSGDSLEIRFIHMRERKGYYASTATLAPSRASNYAASARSWIGIIIVPHVSLSQEVLSHSTGWSSQSDVHESEI